MEFNPSQKYNYSGPKGFLWHNYVGYGSAPEVEVQILTEKNRTEVQGKNI